MTQLSVRILAHYNLHAYMKKKKKKFFLLIEHHHHHDHLSLIREDRWGTTDEFTTSALHFPLFSTAVWDLANSRPVHSLMLSSHLFLCLACLHPPLTVPCKIVFCQTL